jgi:hypothetical protein
MKIAKHIQSELGWTSDARLYALSEPLDGHSHVIVSAADAPYTGPETLIFGCDERGNAVDFIDLDGSFRGELNHDKALKLAGYTPHYNK